jgi:hypothetical protein
MTYPGHAEALDLHLFVARLTAPSVHAPGATATRLSLRCPGCGADAGPLPFGQTIACSCGLNMHPDVVQLYVWKDTRVAAIAEARSPEGASVLAPNGPARRSNVGL